MIDAFEQHRALLFGIAYRMVGSAAEAEDLVQETYLRWERQQADTIVSTRAWLVKTITRLGIDHLRSARKRREEYVGVWLPEPLVDTQVAAPDAMAELSDTLGLAFLVLLEQLAPVERAVFLLREVFDHDYADIAAIVEKSEANCRQIVRRARERLARRSQPEPARSTRPAMELVQRFIDACMTGQIQDLLALLTNDAVLYTDGGGRVRSALRPILGADRIARFFVGIRARSLIDAQAEIVRVNGEPGVLIRRRDGNRSVMAFAMAGDRLRAVYMVNNPDKLQRLSVQAGSAACSARPMMPGADAATPMPTSSGVN